MYLVYLQVSVIFQMFEGSLQGDLSPGLQPGYAKLSLALPTDELAARIILMRIQTRGINVS